MGPNWLWLALLVLSLALTAGCLGTRSKLGQKIEAAMLTENVVEVDPESLAFEVVDFEWAYYNEGAHIRITGKLRNDTGRNQQAVSLYVIAYDEHGGLVTQGRSFVTPTFIPPGGEGDFQINGLPSRTKGIQFLRLVVSARVLG